MKKTIFTFLFLNFAEICFATTKTESLNDALKTSSYEPNYFSIVISLVFVLLLIYITGIIYNKLNKFGANTVKKEYEKSVTDKPVVISTTPICKDKFLQVIEIAGERLLIGVSQNSINLIKELGKVQSKNNEYTVEQQEKHDIVEENLNQIKEEDTSINEEELGLYKKYLR